MTVKCALPSGTSEIDMWTRSASILTGAIAAAAFISLLSEGAIAQTGEPSAARGRAFAVRLCSNCHLVDGSGKSALAGVGTFRGIANRIGQSAERISNVLILPHMPMPDSQLTRDEIQDLLAYLETLRTNPDVPPLIAPGLLSPSFRRRLRLPAYVPLSIANLPPNCRQRNSRLRGRYIRQKILSRTGDSASTGGLRGLRRIKSK